MKRLFTLVALVVAMSFQANAYVSQKTIAVDGFTPATFSTLTPAQFTQLTPSDVEKMLGQELSVKQTLTLKAAQKAAKQQIRKAEKNGMPDASDSQILLIVLAIFIPPLAVYMKDGEVTKAFWLNVILSLCFWLPGQIHALIYVLKD